MTDSFEDLLDEPAVYNKLREMIRHEIYTVNAMNRILESRKCDQKSPSQNPT